MSLIASWKRSPEIIVLSPVKIILGMNPMGLSAPGDKSLGIIFLHTVLKKLLGINPMGISSPRSNC